MNPAASEFQQINRSCLNNSSSKQLFSFSRQIRFGRLKQPLTSRTNYLSSSLQQISKSQAHSFTRSKRELIFQNQQQFGSHPPPNQYQSININQNRGGITMGSKLKLLSQKQAKDSPGPAKYTTSSFDRLNKSIRFPKQKRELKFPANDCKGKDTPAPYMIQTEKLKSILSNYKNVRQTKINKKQNIVNLFPLKAKQRIKQKLQQHEQKIRKKSNDMQKNNIERDRINFETLNRSILFKRQKTTVFGSQPRKTYFDVKNTNPSPANYQYFSQFAKRNKPDTIEAQNSKSLMRSRTKIEIKSRMKTLPVTS